MKKKWIEFKLMRKKPKTNLWEVRKKSDGLVLGVVEWFGRWRQYCFFNWDTDSLYTWDCLKAISDFVKKQNEAHKKKKK